VSSRCNSVNSPASSSVVSNHPSARFVASRCIQTVFSACSWNPQSKKVLIMACLASPPLFLSQGGHLLLQRDIRSCLLILFVLSLSSVRTLTLQPMEAIGSGILLSWQVGSPSLSPSHQQPLLILGDLGVLVSDLQMVIGCLVTVLNASVDRLCQLNLRQLMTASGDELLVRNSLQILGIQVSLSLSLCLTVS
jgi:hypothetical protein